jgi:hypothetical protein
VGKDLERMSRTERIQWQIFILLVVAIGASVYYFSKPINETPLRTNLRKPSAKQDLTGTETLPQLSMLEARVPEFTSEHRNVFEFAGEEESAEDPISVTKPIVPVPQTEALTPVGPDVTYLGFYKERTGSNRTLAAISNGGQIYVGGQGEVLAGKYRVLRVEDEFIEVEYLPEKRIIRLELGRHNSAPPLN